MRALFLLLALASCATSGAPPVNREDLPRARAETLDVVRHSIVQRVLRESPAITRSALARLVTIVPLDDKRRSRMSDAVQRELSIEQLENHAALHLEQALSKDEIHALGAAEASDSVHAVIAAATGVDPPAEELEHFLQKPQGLPEERHQAVKVLVDASWSPLALDRLTRAPLDSAGRVAASALADNEDAKRGELVHIGDTARASDPRALVVAFAFLWRDVDDGALAEARAFFTSELGKKSTDALVESTLAGIDDVTQAIAQRVR